MIFHDIDLQGRVIRIDYTASSARVLGELDLVKTSSKILLLGWLAENDVMLLVFVEPMRDRGAWGRLHLFEPRSGTLRQTSLVADLTSGDFTVAMPGGNQNLAYVRYFSRRQAEYEGFVLDLDRNVLVSAFDFDLGPSSFFAVSTQNPTVGYLVEDHSFPVQTIDLETHRALGERIPEMLQGAHDRRDLFILALEPPYLLAMRRGRNREALELLLLDVDSLQLIANTEPMPYFTGKCVLEAIGEGVEIICVEDGVKRGQVVEVGRVRRFRMTTGEANIVSMKDLTYDPKKQVVLRTREGTYEIFPRYSFDYLSLLEVGRTVMLQFPNGPPAGMSLKEAYETLGGDTAKIGPLPTRKLRIEAAP